MDDRSIYYYDEFDKWLESASLILGEELDLSEDEWIMAENCFSSGDDAYEFVEDLLDERF